LEKALGRNGLTNRKVLMLLYCHINIRSMKNKNNGSNVEDSMASFEDFIGQALLDEDPPPEPEEPKVVEEEEEGTTEEFPVPEPPSDTAAAPVPLPENLDDNPVEVNHHDVTSLLADTEATILV
jgi:hypothetical protein